MCNLRNKKPRMKVRHMILAALLILLTGIHILSWNSKEFTEWYRLHVFPVWTGTLGRISGLFPSSVGEVLIVTGVCLLVFEALYFLAAVAGFFCRFWKKKAFRPNKAAEKQGQTEKQDQIAGQVRADNRNQRFIRTWNCRLLAGIFVYIYVTETLNCYMLYHAPTVEEQYFGHNKEYGAKELVYAYTQIVAKANDLSAKVARDEHGQAVYDGSDAQMYQACRNAMQAQGEKYPYLAGYYPNPKPIRASRFMSQQYLLGIYFPFTMEANYNTVMYPANLPATICHEYSHLKGIIMEDEANYFGFLACIESDDLYLQYSGYLSVIGYLSRQVKQSVPPEMRRGLITANDQVLKDDVFLTEEQWEQVEEKAVVPTETVNKATNAFLEKNLTLNGIADGIDSYSRVVRLIVRYYSEGGS